MTLDVSVVVPVFNPGANIIDAVESVLTQSLDPRRFELIAADDGSTDGTGRWLDEVAERHEGMRVLHLPASGYPGRPRNVGVQAAGGRYVQFLDCDDTLEPGALERLVTLADDSDADVVAGKLSSDFRDVDHGPFQRTQVNERLEPPWRLLDLSLTPHKMFRRDFLLRHDIAFVEEPRHAEDAMFCVHAYLHGASVAIVGDHPCYRYRRRRGFGDNLGDTVAVPAEYYRDIGHILDLIDEHEPDPERRAGMYARFCRVEMLGRLRGRLMLDYDEAYRHEVFTEVRRLLTDRIPERTLVQLPSLPRLQATVVRSSGAAAAVELASALDQLRARPTVVAGWEEHALNLGVSAPLRLRDRPVTLQGTPDDTGYDFNDIETPDGRRLRLRRQEVRASEADVVVVNRESGVTWFVPGDLEVQVDEQGEVAIRGAAVIDPRTVGGGRPLTRGVWDVRLRYVFGGLRRTVSLPAAPRESDLSLRLVPDAGALYPYWTHERRTLALDAGQWMHAAHTLPGAAASLSGRRLVITAPRVTASEPIDLAAHVLVPRDGAPARLVEATAQVTPAGTHVEMTMRRSDRSSTRGIWWRLADARGMAAAAELSLAPG